MVQNQFFQHFYFGPKLLIFDTRGFSGNRNRLAQVPSFKKIFVTPYRGYSMLKNQFFQLLYLGSKLVDFWYSGFSGTRNRLAHVPRSKKIFMTLCEKINFLTWGTPIGGHKNFCGTQDLRQLICRVPQSQSTKNQPI